MSHTTTMRYLALATTIILLLLHPCNTQRQLEQCVIDLGLEQQSVIHGGQIFPSRDNPQVFLEQHRNGNLVIKRGQTIIWTSGVTTISFNDNCFTRLQLDGHMLTIANSNFDSRRVEDKGSRAHDFQVFSWRGLQFPAYWHLSRLF